MSVAILREIAVSLGLHRRKPPVPYQPASDQPMQVIAHDNGESQEEPIRCQSVLAVCVVAIFAINSERRTTGVGDTGQD